MEQIKQFWERQDSKYKRIYTVVGAIAVIFIIASLVPSREPVQRFEEKPEVQVDILADDGGLADAQRQQAQIKALEDQNQRYQTNMEQMSRRIQRLQDSVAAATGLRDNPEQLGQIVDEVNTLREKVRQMEQGGLTVTDSNQAPVLVLGGEDPASPAPEVSTASEVPVSNPFASIDEDDAFSIPDPLADVQGAISGDAKPPTDRGFSFGSNQSFDRAPPTIQIIKADEPTFRPQRTGGRVPGQTSRDKRGEDLEAPPAPDVYIPSQSLFEGVLLTGMDAPTGSSSAREPYPVTIRLTSLAFLPNRYTTNVKECFVGAAGYGRLDSERVHLRTEMLSCVFADGGIVDTKIDGFVTGEDGKVGLRGTVVERTGALLARAALAGVGSGLSQATEPRQIQSVRTGARAGGIQFDAPDPAEVLEIGAYSGAAKGLEKLGEYYLERAEEIYPIIEIDAMRKVTVHLTAGVKLKVLDDSAYGVLAQNSQ